ncbi:MAG: rod shape-determining protein MreC, partial [Caulobacterales bacterium]|nr:rod shape-determining protein MreC [Caulobacterales bacterium]
MARRNGYNRRREGGLGNWASLVVLIALIGGGAFLVKSQMGASVGAYGNDFGAKIGAIINAPINFVQNGFSNIGAIFTNAEEVRRLKRENKALLEWRDGARAIAEKLETYEKLNNIAGDNNNKILTGRLVAEINGPFAKSGLVNIGSNQGVAANWVVVNQYGMVGRVVSVGKDSARVLLLNDSDSRLPIMGEKTRGRAMLIGDKTDAPRLEHLNIPALIAKGERILTSGDDGIIPRGINVGTADIGPDGKWRVKLSVYGNPIDYVKLIAPNYIPPPKDKTNGIIKDGVISFDGADARTDAAGAILPLDSGAAQIPVNSSPEAIAQAQQLRKMQLELEATKKNLDATKKANAQSKTS